MWNACYCASVSICLYSVSHAYQYAVDWQLLAIVEIEKLRFLQPDIVVTV